MESRIEKIMSLVRQLRKKYNVEIVEEGTNSLNLIKCELIGESLTVKYLKNRLMTGKKAIFSTQIAATKAINDLQNDKTNLSSQDLKDILMMKEIIKQSEIIAFEYEDEGFILKGFIKELDEIGLKQKFREGNGAITVNA